MSDSTHLYHLWNHCPLSGFTLSRMEIIGSLLSPGNTLIMNDICIPSTTQKHLKRKQREPRYGWTSQMIWKKEKRRTAILSVYLFICPVGQYPFPLPMEPSPHSGSPWATWNIYTFIMSPGYTNDWYIHSFYEPITFILKTGKLLKLLAG